MLITGVEEEIRGGVEPPLLPPHTVEPYAVGVEDEEGESHGDPDDRCRQDDTEGVPPEHSSPEHLTQWHPLSSLWLVESARAAVDLMT